MPFSPYIGNPLAKAFLQKLLATKAIPQVLLFDGPKGVGKCRFAIAFAQGLLGKEAAKRIEERNHPDVCVLEPEGKNGCHSLASVQKILSEASLPPFESEKKIYIIDEADKMLTASSNALLKTLEDPLRSTHIVLLTQNIEEILPTIVSRSIRVPFYPIPEEEIVNFLMREKGVKQQEAEQIAEGSQGSFSKALDICKQIDNPVKLQFLEIIRHYFLEADDLYLIDSLNAIEKGYDKKSLSEEEMGEFFSMMDRLLETLLYWIRDLHVYHELGKKASLHHKTHVEQIENQLKRGFRPSLEVAYELVASARLSIQRSIKPKVVFQELFFGLMEDALFRSA